MNRLIGSSAEAETGNISSEAIQSVIFKNCRKLIQLLNRLQ